ncbi:DEAD-box ATP-dependent RNA helicase 46 [Linum perenne]
MAAAAAPRFAPEDPTLPKPWRGLVDGKTGYLYFWNPETNITQYERPTAPSLSSKPSPMPINSSAQVEQPSRHANSPVKEDDRYGRSSNGGSTNTNTQTRNGQVCMKPQNERSVVAQSVSNGTIDEAGRVAATGLASSAGVSVLSAEAYRRRHEITVTGGDVPPPFISFEATGFPPELLREVYSAGFTAPTPIQAQSWAVVLQSRDIVAIAKTGSGKTLGYLIPAFLHLKRLRNDTRMGPTVLVLSPTRELATQIQDEAVKFGKSSRISCTCLYGGAPKGPQLGQLDRGTDIVVATPGRLNDILEMRRVNLGQISYLVLDEADRMLDMGFEPQIRKIVKEVPTRRQTLMYTATWPKEVRKIAADLLVNPVQVNIGNVDELVANKSITQYVEVVPPMEKHKRLEQILRSQEPGSKVIIFCSTKKMCDILARNLTRQFGAAAIHGDKSQGERDQVLSQFRSGRSPLLVATDVAARGLDVKDIRAVINYDFPTGVEDYVHRIGRTGRAGATGVAYTFFGEQDAKHATDLVKLLEGANQKVPPEIRDMASRGGGMGRSRRWGNGDGGGRGGYGSTGGSYGSSGGGGFGSSGGGRGSSWSGGRGYGQDNNDRYGGGGGGDKAGSSWNDRFKSGERERSRSPGPVRDRSPPRSFHQAMMDRR